MEIEFKERMMTPKKIPVSRRKRKFKAYMKKEITEICKKGMFQKQSSMYRLIEIAMYSVLHKYEELGIELD